MKAIFAILVLSILAIPTASFAWDENGLIFNQTNQCTNEKCIMEMEAEAKLANLYNVEESTYTTIESEITMEAVCVNGYKFLLTVDSESGNLDVIQIIGDEGFPLTCKK